MQVYFMRFYDKQLSVLLQQDTCVELILKLLKVDVVLFNFFTGFSKAVGVVANKSTRKSQHVI